jgi:hypothetical protein
LRYGNAASSSRLTLTVNALIEIGDDLGRRLCSIDFKNS